MSMNKRQKKVGALMLAAICLLDSAAFQVVAQPLPASALFHDGFEKLSSSDFRGAAEDFQAGLQKDPKNALAHFYLAKAYLGLSEGSLATLELNSSLKLSPNSKVASEARGLLKTLAASSDSAKNTDSKASDDKAEQQDNIVWLKCVGEQLYTSSDNSEPQETTRKAPRPLEIVFAVNIAAQKVAEYSEKERELHWIGSDDPKKYDIERPVLRGRYDSVVVSNAEIVLTCDKANYCGAAGTQGGSRSSKLIIQRKDLSFTESYILNIGPRQSDGYYASGDLEGHGTCDRIEPRTLGPDPANKI